VSDLALGDLRVCFEGVIPAVVATAAADGTPNVAFLSRVHLVDDERVALSNQFFSKTVRNLAENPRASVLVVNPATYEQYRLTLSYERTERRGPVFDRLREDVDRLAALTGMEKVFKLRSADIYRVSAIEQTPRPVRPASAPPHVDNRTVPTDGTLGTGAPGELAGLVAITNRVSRAPDLETVVTTTLAGMAELFGYEHSLLLLLDETGRSLYTIGSHGYDTEGVGSEVVVGEGIIGMAAARGRTIRLGNLRQMHDYAASVRRAYEQQGGIGPGREIPVPGLVDAASRVAVPARSLGQVIGVLVVDSPRAVAFDDTDEQVLTVVATLIANAVEADRAQERAADEEAPSVGSGISPTATHEARTATSGLSPVKVRFFAVDGSVFLETDYLIKGVAGRVLWSLLGHHQRDGRTEFTTRELRLDASLDLPPVRDNLDTRLLLLKRRLDEHSAPVRIERTGRGRFRLVVTAPLDLDEPRLPEG
jgi:adenylate cyclase